MSNTQHAQRSGVVHEGEQGTCCIPFIKLKKICKCKKSEEQKSLIDKNNGQSEYNSTASTAHHDESTPSQDGNDSGYSCSNPAMTQTPNSQDSNQGNENTKKESKVETIEMRELGLTAVDKIFKDFEKTFKGFSKCQDDMEKAMKDFKTAVKSTGDFRFCVSEFKQQLDGRVTFKKLAPKFPKAVQKGNDSVHDAAIAMESIFKAYNDMEKLPVKVVGQSVVCLKDAMELDIEEIAQKEFGGSGFDISKIPKQLKALRDNIKEIKKAPKIVKSFYEYATEIVSDVFEVLDDKSAQAELGRRKAKVEDGMQQQVSQLKKVEDPQPPKEIKFTSLGVPGADRSFNDIAKLVNPVIKLSKDLFETRKRLEKAIKAISKFHDDPSKGFDDYLEELKTRLKKDEVHIVISVNGNHVEVEKVEGVEPKAAEDMEYGFKGVLKSGDELIDVGPDSIKDLRTLIQDLSNISKADFKGHVPLKEIPSKLSVLRKNIKEAAKIPSDLKFFFSFVRNLVMDIKDVLQTKKDDAVQDSEVENEEQQK